MTKNWLIVLVVLFLGVQAHAQNTFSISGIVRDKKGNLPGAAIYLSGYKIATVADNGGKFIINNLRPGNYDLLVQMVGYLPFSKNVVISDKSVEVTLVLKENVVRLNEVVIRADPNRERYIRVFKAYFIGLTENAKDCKIMNPNILRVDFDRDSGILTVKTDDDFLVIINKALGYKIKYLIKLFQYNDITKVVYYEGYPYYEDMSGSDNQKRRWAAKRLKAFKGSPQHFYRSLFNNTSKEEGFIINKLILNQTIEDQIDSLADTNLGLLTSPKLIYPGAKKSNLLGNATPTNTIFKGSESNGVLDLAEVLPDTLVHVYSNQAKKIDFTNILYIIYTKELESKQYQKMIVNPFLRPPSLRNVQISLLKMLVAPIYFYENGGIFNPRSSRHSGYWAWEKIADSLPLDYMP